MGLPFHLETLFPVRNTQSLAYAKHAKIAYSERATKIKAQIRLTLNGKDDPEHTYLLRSIVVESAPYALPISARCWTLLFDNLKEFTRFIDHETGFKDFDIIENTGFIHYWEIPHDWVLEIATLQIAEDSDYDTEA